MKKTIFLGIAALLTLAVFSCGDPTIPGASVGSTDGITLAGPELAKGRALVGATSEAGTNYYEATFQRGELNAGVFTGGQIIRSKWGYARKGRIQLEPGNYKVILMAGRLSDTTLLGVGRASSITNFSALTETSTTTPLPLSATPSVADLIVNIQPGTTDLYFTVYALLNRINGAGDSTTSFFTAVSTDAAPTPTTKDELGNKVPVFMITKAAPPASPGGTVTGTPTVATWKFGLGNFPGVTGATSPNVNDLIGLFGPELLLKSVNGGVNLVGPPTVDVVAGAAALYETGFSYTDTYDVPQKLLAKSITSAGANTGSGTAAAPYVTKMNGTVTISVTAPNDDGMVQLALEVPVHAIAASDEAMTWFIRGGLNNGAIDAGITPNFAKPGQIGGAVVLGFGNLSNFPVINLIPNHPFIYPAP